MVRDYYHDLLGHLRDQRPLQFAWRLPEWIHDPALIDGLPSNQTMAEYHLFHDCGKPICRVVDAEGRQHFPDHAAISEAAWLAAGGDPEIGDHIGRHTSELQSLMRISYAVFCLKKKIYITHTHPTKPSNNNSNQTSEQTT